MNKPIGAGGGFLTVYANDKARLRHAMRAADLKKVRFRLPLLAPRSPLSAPRFPWPVKSAFLLHWAAFCFLLSRFQLCLELSACQPFSLGRWNAKHIPPGSFCLPTPRSKLPAPSSHAPHRGNT